MSTETLIYQRPFTRGPQMYHNHIYRGMPLTIWQSIQWNIRGLIIFAEIMTLWILNRLNGQWLDQGERQPGASHHSLCLGNFHPTVPSPMTVLITRKTPIPLENPNSSTRTPMNPLIQTLLTQHRSEVIVHQTIGRVVTTRKTPSLRRMRKILRVNSPLSNHISMFQQTTVHTVSRFDGLRREIFKPMGSTRRHGCQKYTRSCLIYLPMRIARSIDGKASISPYRM